MSKNVFKEVLQDLGFISLPREGTKYYVHYVSFHNTVIDWGEFTTLEKAMDNALYWLEKTRIFLDRIEIFKADYEESFHRELIAVING